jgi:superoxide reductase
MKMAQRLEIYKCDGCGQVIAVLTAAPGDLACCGTPMKKLDAKTADAGTEKHVPYIEKVDGGFKVTVGRNAAHPMADDHYIEWIALIADGKVSIQFLEPGMAPEAVFQTSACTDVCALEFCNKHGLWAS